MKTSIVFFICFHSVIFSQSNWVKLNTGVTGSIQYIYFIDGNTGYASSGSLLLKTINGGLNWTSSDPAGINLLPNLYFINDLTGFAVPDDIYKTTDGGASFFLVKDLIDRARINFPNNTTGFSVGIDVLKTTNQGASWFNIPIPSGYYGFSRTGYFMNENTGIIGASMVQHPQNFTHIYKTTNSGSSWQEVYTSSSITFFGNAVFMNTNWYISYSGGVFRSTNSGLTWILQQAPNNNVMAIAFITEGSGFYCGGQNSLYRTTNFGASWQFIVTDSVTSFYDIQFPTISTGYLCGTNGVIFKTTNGGGVLGVNQSGNGIPGNFLLYQNYPNPFNPETKIRFAISSNVKGETSNVKLIIYDFLGREIVTLVNQNLQPGIYEADWDAANFSSGIYYYKIMSGDFTQTKKMVLIK